MFPQYLRDAGYYVSNDAKEDYNLEKPGQVWDESSQRAHWRKRSPGQPFFAVFNFTVTHESRIRARPHQAVHDPARVRVPAYHPDTEESRTDWAQYYDKLSEMDTLAGQVPAQLREDGLEADTSVFCWADHGPGMPRGKRWTSNSGLNVPMMLYIPEKYRALRPSDYRKGGESRRLVGFIDLAPTVLSLAGIEPPAHLQGHAFAGPFEAPPQPYAYAFRGRMDERYDMVRSVRNERYIYIRNFMPHRIYGQYIRYVFQTPTTAVWRRLYAEGRLQPPRPISGRESPLKNSTTWPKIPTRRRTWPRVPSTGPFWSSFGAARREWSLAIRDLGFLPEDGIHSRSAGVTPHEMGSDPARYPLDRIMRMAELASSLEENAEPALRRGFEDSDAAVRYGAAPGALMRGRTGFGALLEPLRGALSDKQPAVRIAAAEALGRFGHAFDAERALAVLLEHADAERHGIFRSMAALNALDYMDEKARGVLAQIERLPQIDPKMHGEFRNYLPNLIEKIRMDLE